jgi:hypothetical protein
VYVRKTKIDPHVARMDARLAELGAAARKTASTNQDDELEFEEDNPQPPHGPLSNDPNELELAEDDLQPLHGPLFDDPANGVQPMTTACQWTPLFTPMASPLGLIQERLFYCPWRLLISTIFLNKTRGSQARPILFEFLRRFPTPEDCIGADVESLATLLRPLGLYNRRARSLVLFSRSYIDNFGKIQKLLGDEEDDGFDVTELCGKLLLARFQLLKVDPLSLGPRNRTVRARLVPSLLQSVELGVYQRRRQGAQEVRGLETQGHKEGEGIAG